MSPIHQMRIDYEQGMPIKDIAHKHHAQRSDVREAIRLNGWKRLVTVGGAHTDPSVKAAIRADYLRGCGPPCLRKKHGVHNTTLYRWIREEGWLADREARAALPPSTSEILALDPVAFDARVTALLQAEQDLAALREKHAAQTAALAQVRDDYLADDARYLRQHREDAATIASLRSEIEALRSGKTA